MSIMKLSGVPKNLLTGDGLYTVIRERMSNLLESMDASLSKKRKQKEFYTLTVSDAPFIVRDYATVCFEIRHIIGNLYLSAAHQFDTTGGWWSRYKISLFRRIDANDNFSLGRRVAYATMDGDGFAGWPMNEVIDHFMSALDEDCIVAINEEIHRDNPYGSCNIFNVDKFFGGLETALFHQWKNLGPKYRIDWDTVYTADRGVGVILPNAPHRQFHELEDCYRFIPGSGGIVRESGVVRIVNMHPVVGDHDFFSTSPVYISRYGQEDLSSYEFCYRELLRNML